MFREQQKETWTPYFIHIDNFFLSFQFNPPPRPRFTCHTYMGADGSV
jgi:hypothetical protein